MGRYRRETEKERKQRVTKAKNKRRKKRHKANTNFRLIRNVKRAEKLRLRGIPSASFLHYLAFNKGQKPKIEVVKPKEEKKEKVKRHSNYRAILRAKKVRRTEVKILNSRRDRKKELEMRIAKQREKGRIRTENKKKRKVTIREAKKKLSKVS